VLSLADVRRIWPDLLEQVKKMRRFTWILLSQNAQVIGVDATSLTVAFKTAGARDSFVGGGSQEILRQAAIDMVGADWQIEVAVDPSAEPGAETAPRVVRPAVPDAAPTAASAAGPSTALPTSSTVAPDGPPAWAGDDDSPRESGARSGSLAAARSNITATRRGDEPVSRHGPDLDADAHRDDLVAEDNALDSTELLQRELGATVIEEIPHD
jgi:DNA polymerase-3 subunit gamma/tau